MKLKKILTLMCCAVLLVCISVGATVAYLTAQDTVTNTFTVGNVQITLDETDVDVYGKQDGTSRVEANTYKLMPGHTYIKDPIVHVQNGSEECYVRAQVTVSDIAKLKAAFPVEKYPTFYNGDIFLLQMLVGGWDNTKWEFKTVNGGMYEFWYTAKVDARTQAVDLPAIFSTITIPGTADATAIANLNNVTVNVVAHAIQADGFADATAAWAAWN